MESLFPKQFGITSTLYEHMSVLCGVARPQLSESTNSRRSHRPIIEIEDARFGDLTAAPNSPMLARFIDLVTNVSINYRLRAFITAV